MTTWELSLLATPKAVPEVRRLLSGYDYDVRLCVSEMLTNVVDHVGEGTPVTVRVVGLPTGHTRIEVTDPDPRALPLLARPVCGTDESGRGLTLLDALTLRWGVEPCPDHKTIWCELAGEPPPRDVRQPAAPAVESVR
ncbi:ATP-binding protein [Streptomyces sp. AC512_CC834]|uniref:ATP-binding protein n=1 Tax=Streptomyces sp. AC512_CC834 TaxID=2823691 RepID=UPI001C275BB9|nr:ATP-binding protein [Streptomyces sp. AC512_CC834]